MKVLMLTWEFPPLIAGGLGMACYGIVKSLLSLGVEVDLVLPAKQTAFFPLRKPEDADTLPVVIVGNDTVNKVNTEFHKNRISYTKQYLDENLSTTSLQDLSIRDKLEYLGLSVSPETYINTKYVEAFRAKIYSSTANIGQRDILTDIENRPFIFNPKSTTPAEASQTERNLLETIGESLIGDEDIFRKVQEFTIKASKIAVLNNSYDVIHAHDWLTYPAGMFIKNLSGKPLTAHIHATEFDRAGGTGDERVHQIEYSGMAYADRVIAVSKYTAQMVMTRYRIYPAKITIIHNAHTSIGKSDEASPKPRRIFSGPTILFLGRITIQKGPDYFLDVAKLVLQKHPQARFIMAGTGDMARKLLHKSASFMLKNKFLFAGFLNRKEVDLILCNADIYLLPSVSEPFGIAPLEAMAYGITAIISKQSGVSEVVENAYKIDFWDVTKMADTISYLIENPDLCREMGIKGMEEVEKIRWDDAAKAIKQLYEELVVSLDDNAGKMDKPISGNDPD